MSSRLPDHQLYDGHYLAFAGSWLGKSNHLLTEEQREAGKAIREAFTHRWQEQGGTGDAVALMLDVERKALAAIEKHGAAAYIAKVRDVTAKKEQAA